jgi:hypothetical protein
VNTAEAVAGSATDLATTVASAVAEAARVKVKAVSTSLRLEEGRRCEPHGSHGRGSGESAAHGLARRGGVALEGDIDARTCRRRAPLVWVPARGGHDANAIRRARAELSLMPDVT